MTGTRFETPVHRKLVGFCDNVLQMIITVRADLKGDFETDDLNLSLSLHLWMQRSVSDRVSESTSIGSKS
jgi:hypothetical protein